DMLHMPTDLLIGNTLQLFKENLGKALPIDHDWNRTDPGSTTKGSYWSDFLCWLKDTLILKGEEKASAKDFKMALYDLDEKFN
ncbi:10052_t:CDS:1, partial [Entrophospora sp. SA101]